MGAHNAICAALEGYFKDGWVVSPGGAARTLVRWPNKDFVPPTGAPWVGFDLQVVDAGRALMTGDRNTGHEHAGVVTVQVFTPPGKGAGAARLLADLVADLFKERIIPVIGFNSSIASKTPKVFSVGESGGFFQVNATIPFDFMES